MSKLVQIAVPLTMRQVRVAQLQLFTGSEASKWGKPFMLQIK
jgi:hypothetical protein